MKTTKLDTYAQFLEFNRQNPSLMTYFVERAREARDAGYKRYGFPLLFNLARWEFGVKARNTDFELDNDIAPYYSRRIMMDCPDLFMFFEVRASSADWQTGWAKFKEARLHPAPLPQPIPVDVPETMAWVISDMSEPKPVISEISEPKPVKKVYYVTDDDTVATRYA